MGDVPELPVRGREFRRFWRGKGCWTGGKGRLLGMEKERSDVGVKSSMTAVLETLLVAGAPEAGATDPGAAVED